MTILAYATHVLGDVHLAVNIDGFERARVRLTKRQMLNMMEVFVEALRYHEPPDVPVSDDGLPDDEFMRRNGLC